MPPSMVDVDLKAPYDPVPESGDGLVAPASGTEDHNFHQRLRRETRPAHDAVDETFSRYDLADVEAYGRFLVRHAQALTRLKPHLGPGVEPDIEAMARCVEDDLRALGVDWVAAGPGAVALDGFGVAYVLRGSRMGARILRGQVGRGFPARYLGFGPALSWRDFLVRLEHHAENAGKPGRRHIITSARCAFAAFGPVWDCAT